MNIFSSRFLLLSLLAVVAFSSCDKKVYQTIVELDEENIQEYIQKNNLNVTPFGTTGMYYEVLEDGTGEPLDYSKVVPLVYSFKTHDGSYTSVDTFAVGNRYADYLGYFPYGSSVANSQPGSPLDKEEGIKMVLKQALKNANGKIRIIVPSRLAYGRNGSGKIGSNQSIDYVIHAIDPENLPDYEDNSIKNYIPTIGNQLTDFETTSTGIYYNITDPGSGAQISPTSQIEMGYTLRLLNGSIIEQSASDSTSMSLTSTILGWKEVLPKLKAGGKVRMILPSPQAYGLQGNISTTAGVNSIPAFSPLDFEVSVKSVVE